MPFKLKYFRSYDMFGHLVALNFNKRSNNHKTLIGGLFSFAIHWFLRVYVVLNFATMFLYRGNINNSLDGSSPLEDLGRVDINGTDNVIFYVLSN